ncbi:MAG: histone deacetylase family protein [Candidatus Dormibacteria bacterium]
MSSTPQPLVLFYEDLFLEHDSPGHPESAERLRAITARLRSEPLLPESWWRPASEAATEEALRRVHSRSLLSQLQQLCNRGGGWVDSDTYCRPNSYDVARVAAGASLEAVDSVLSARARAALALVRPPGHHATRERAMGFCLLNNVAVAAREAQARGVARLAIVDLDVHHGNGTQEAFYEDPAVLYCSLHQFPLYPGSGRADEVGAGPGRGTTLNLPQPPGTGPGPWLSALQDRVLPALRRHRPELILVSAGFDALAGDPLASLHLEPDTYRRAARLLQDAARDLSQGRSAWFLEGGYRLREMAESVRLCALELAGQPA